MNRRKIKHEPPLISIIRVITGLVFIFSSTVKGFDPIGTAYRVEDYLLVYGWTGLLHYALALSIFLIVVEFLIGIALVFRLKSKLATLGLLLIMVVFTVVTYLDARYNMVPDCGCFGDAVKLTNWQTFYKNIYLIILAVIIFAYRNRIRTKMPQGVQGLILVVVVGLYTWFVVFNYRHLPMLDFRDWKVGNDMKAEGIDQVKTFVKYRNILTGEEQEFLSPDYPWNDSVWMAEWTFVDQRLDDSGRILKHGVMLEDAEGNDWTEAVFENPDFQLVVVAYDLEESNPNGLKAVKQVIQDAEALNIPIVLLTSSGEPIIERVLLKHEIEVESLFADDIELKAMIRSNPGLMLMHDGVVLEKWPFRGFPDREKLASYLTP
ncbi:MAG: hypothetical protein KKF98_16680 [Bacteroidetes bacterium]|nr:hypothetical protein [Bacteroidota bacterium]